MKWAWLVLGVLCLPGVAGVVAPVREHVHEEYLVTLIADLAPGVNVNLANVPWRIFVDYYPAQPDSDEFNHTGFVYGTIVIQGNGPGTVVFPSGTAAVVSIEEAFAGCNVTEIASSGGVSLTTRWFTSEWAITFDRGAEDWDKCTATFRVIQADTAETWEQVIVVSVFNDDFERERDWEPGHLLLVLVVAAGGIMLWATRKDVVVRLFGALLVFVAMLLVLELVLYAGVGFSWVVWVPLASILGVLASYMVVREALDRVGFE